MKRIQGRVETMGLTSDDGWVLGSVPRHDDNSATVGNLARPPELLYMGEPFGLLSIFRSMVAQPKHKHTLNKTDPKSVSTKMVIVGRAAGGISAAFRAQKLDENGHLTLHEQGNDRNYAHCEIPSPVGGGNETDTFCIHQSATGWNEQVSLDMLDKLYRYQQRDSFSAPQSFKSFNYRVKLIITTVALRCYVRIKLTGGFGADDAFSVAALIIFVLGSACLLVGVGTGMAPSLKHLSLTTQNPSDYLGATIHIRVDLRGRDMSRQAIDQLVSSPLHYRTQIHLDSCQPVSAFWNHPESCNTSGTIKVTYAHSAIVSASDWALIILPIFIVYHLHLGFLTKLYVGMVLALGSW
ncbi:hypothetical protein F1880_002587 [Penicillium rolfsii]|nr:hypothetical protein F1880_002587 [Penicillium rolfsii]